MKKIILFSLYYFSLCAASSLHAQTWWTMGGLNTVRALASYNGSEYAGGDFTTATGSCIAKWDTSWLNVGSGIPGTSNKVFALTVYNGALYAGGVFTSAGGVSASNIAKWNGSSWSALGSGVNADVTALTVYNNELIAGGSFTTAGGISAKHIAKWNGTTWSALGTGLDSAQNFLYPYISSLAVYNGELCVGGCFRYPFRTLAKWNGSSWSSIGGHSGYDVGFLSPAPYLCVYNNFWTEQLYLSQPGQISRWNGTTWSNVATFDNIPGSYYQTTVMVEYSHYLFLAGSFTHINGTSYSNIARWDGVSFGSAGGISVGSTGVCALSVSPGGRGYVGGNITSAGGVSVNNVAQFGFCLPPQVITAGGPTTICPGGSVTLTLNPEPFPAFYYLNLWYLDGVELNPGTVVGSTSWNATAAGNYYCTVITSCGSKTSNTITVTVNGSPATITAGGATTFCSGDSVMLNANTGAGLTYQWRLNNVNISGATASAYAAKSTGNYTCVVTNSGCSPTSNQIAVTVNTPAAITAAGPTTFCSGGSVILNANSGAGNTYQWKLNGGIISGATLSSYSANASGNYTCVVANACGTLTSNAISATVNPNPTAAISAAGPVIFCFGGSVMLNANTGTGLNYQWKINAANIPGATSASYSATGGGTYTCLVSNATCNATSNSIIVSFSDGPNTFVSQPNGLNGQDAEVTSYSTSSNSNYGSVPELNALAWTAGGLYVNRNFFRFDLSSIPANSNIQQATLTLFNNPAGFNSGSHSNLVGSNASWLQKVTAAWAENTITWNNQPATTTVNQVTIPQSTSAHQDYNLDVTTLVQGMVANPATNYGWLLRLQSEVQYKALVFASSDNADSTKRPKITVSYFVPLTASITASGPVTFCSGDSVLLNVNTGPWLSYQWKINGSDVPGAVSSLYYAKVAGNYTCYVASSCVNSTSNSLTVTVNNCLNTRTFFQGYYTGSGLMRPMLYINDLNADPTACDSITVELHSPTQPYNTVFSSRSLLRTNGSGQVFFPSGFISQSYYIVIKHKGSVDVWSKTPVLFSSAVVNFDLTAP